MAALVPREDASAASTKVLTSVKVYDATNKKIGQAIGNNGLFPVLLLKSGTLIVPVYAGVNGFVGIATTVMFTEPGCAGQPYLHPGFSVSLLPETAVREGKVWIPDPSATPGSFDIQSVYFEQSRVCDASSAGGSVVPAIAVMDLPAFTPPLSIR